jgi:lipopolysaccharide export LptBFGC system permease protein LptF
MPLALFVGVVCALWRRSVTTRVRRTISVLAAATSLALFFIINGLVPASGEAFRETLAARAELEGRQYVLERGPMELSLLEVRRQALSLERESRPRQAGRLLLTFHQRISLAAAPLALTLLAFGLSHARARMAATIAVTACTVFVAWMFAASNMDRAMLSHEWVAIALAWFPQALLVATGMGLLTVRLKPRATGSG